MKGQMEQEIVERTTAAQDPDRGAERLTQFLVNRIPFFFVRYGDGALECMAGRPGLTCDREAYTSELGAALRRGWGALMAAQHEHVVFVGDWLTASFDVKSAHTRYEQQYEALLAGSKAERIHFESLLLMRESQALVNFYRVIKADRRDKVFMGPAYNAGAAKMLGARHLITPMEANLHQHFEEANYKLWDGDFEILLYGAGMAAHVPAIETWRRFPGRTYINLGSAMDPLFYRQTRRQQIPMAAARALFAELLA